MIILVDTEKHSTKIWHQLLIKIPSILAIKATFLNMIKDIHKKSTTNIVLNCERPNVFSLILKTNQGCLLSLLLFNNFYSIESSQFNEAIKLKSYSDCKRSNIVLIYRQHDLLCSRAYGNSTNLLELINDFGEVHNTQKPTVLLCIINNLELKLKNNMVYNSIKNTEYSGIHLTKMCKSFTLKTMKYC